MAFPPPRGDEEWIAAALVHGNARATTDADAQDVGLFEGFNMLFSLFSLFKFCLV